MTLGTFNSTYTRSKFDSLDVAGQLNSAFFEKRLLLDLLVGRTSSGTRTCRATGAG